jgi:hypothetical protein
VLDAEGNRMGGKQKHRSPNEADKHNSLKSIQSRIDIERGLAACNSAVARFIPARCERGRHGHLLTH